MNPDKVFTDSIKPVEKAFIDTFKPVETFFNKNILPIIDSQIFALVLSWLIVTNIVFSVDELPDNVSDIVRHPVIKFFLTFIGVYASTKNFYVSLGSTLAFLIVYYSIKWGLEPFKLVWPETNTIPGCSDVKVSDLLALFDGDKEQLKRTMYASGVPLDLKINDTNAPLIATYLINFGHSITESCKAPN